MHIRDPIHHHPPCDSILTDNAHYLSIASSVCYCHGRLRCFYVQLSRILSTALPLNDIVYDRQERMVTRGTIPCKCYNTIINRISVVSQYNNNFITVIVTKSNQVGHAMFKLIEFHSYLRWRPTDIAVLLVVAKLRSGSFGQDLLVYTRCTCITWDRLNVCEYNERQ